MWKSWESFTVFASTVYLRIFIMFSFFEEIFMLKIWPFKWVLNYLLSTDFPLESGGTKIIEW